MCEGVDFKAWPMAAALTQLIEYCYAHSHIYGRRQLSIYLQVNNTSPSCLSLSLFHWSVSISQIAHDVFAGPSPKVQWKRKVQSLLGRSKYISRDRNWNSATDKFYFNDTQTVLILILTRLNCNLLCIVILIDRYRGVRLGIGLHFSHTQRENQFIYASQCNKQIEMACENV